MAFGRYALFETDIFYISFLPDSRGLGPGYMNAGNILTQKAALFEDEEPLMQSARLRRGVYDNIDKEGQDVFWNSVRQEAYEDGALMTFTSFLDDPSARGIKRLAMTVEFFDSIPLQQIPQETLDTMRKKMPAWEGTLIVFGDLRQDTTAWSDTTATFRDTCPCGPVERNVPKPKDEKTN